MQETFQPMSGRVIINTFHHPTDIVTKSDMVPFNSPTGGCGPVLSYLDLPIGTGQLTLPIDANLIITSNGQFFTLADQGNNGLKMFQNNIPSCNGTFPQEVRSLGTLASPSMHHLVDFMFIQTFVSVLLFLL